jgi:ElaB/YqjD/DUF883 family membrane-anchored ribosome-binding protein
MQLLKKILSTPDAQSSDIAATMRDLSQQIIQDSYRKNQVDDELDELDVLADDERCDALEAEKELLKKKIDRSSRTLKALEKRLKETSQSGRKNSLDTIANYLANISQDEADKIRKEVPAAFQTIGTRAAAGFEIGKMIKAGNKFLADNGSPRRIKHPMELVAGAGKPWKALHGYIGFPLTLEDFNNSNAENFLPFVRDEISPPQAPGKAFTHLCQKVLNLLLKKPLDVPEIPEDEIPKPLRGLLRGKQQKVDFLEAAE